MISALLLGTSLAVPKGKDVGGAFQRIPLCHSATHTGCVIAYASFRSTIRARQLAVRARAGRGHDGRVRQSGALGGGSGALHAYLSSGGRSIVDPRGAARLGDAGQADRHAFVSVPGC